MGRGGSIRQDADGDGAARWATVALGAAALLSLAVPLLAPAGWGIVAGIGAPAVLGRGALVTAALAAAMYAWDTLPRRRWPVAARAGAALAIGLALAALFRAAAQVTPIGDWELVARAAEAMRPLGKWYGASLAHALFHRVVGGPLGLAPIDSVRWLSSLAGAATAWLATDVARRLGLPARLRTWPLLYAGAFGIVGVGLGHVEIYAVVGAWLALVVALGLRALEEPSPRRVLALGAAAGLAVASYVGLVLLVPATAGLLAWLAWRGTGRARFAALGALLLAALLAAAIPALGPAAEWNSLGGAVAGQFGRGAKLNAGAKPWFLPPDVHWPLLTNLIAPRYWFAGWHVRDLAQIAWLGDRIGLLVILALGGGVLLPRLARRAAPPPAVTWCAAVALPYLAFAALVVHGIQYPWDWDLTSYAALPASLLGAALLATLGTGRCGRAADAALVVAALGAQCSGAAFLAACAAPPHSFGEPAGGLALGVARDVLDLARGRQADVQLWLRNTGPTPIVIAEQPATGALVARRDALRVRTRLINRSLIGTRTIAPGATVPLTTFSFLPQQMQAAEGDGVAEGAWRALPGLAPPGDYTAQWLLRLTVQGAGAPVELSSGLIALTVAADDRGTLAR